MKDLEHKKPLEQRFYEFEIRAEENEQGNIITGRPIVYNSVTNLGDWDEVIESGALDEADLTDVRFLVNHDTKMIPLARSRRNNGNSTMQLTPNFEGLDMSANIDVENNSTARKLKSAVTRGDITGMSFMFSVMDEEWDNLDSDHPIRRIKKIGSVVEVSAVTWPAYDATTINARGKEALENARQALENAREQRVKSVETDNLELLKLKTETLNLGGN